MGFETPRIAEIMLALSPTVVINSPSYSIPDSLLDIGINAIPTRPGSIHSIIFAQARF